MIAIEAALGELKRRRLDDAERVKRSRMEDAEQALREESERIEKDYAEQMEVVRDAAAASAAMVPPPPVAAEPDVEEGERASRAASGSSVQAEDGSTIAAAAREEEDEEDPLPLPKGSIVPGKNSVEILRVVYGQTGGGVSRGITVLKDKRVVIFACLHSKYANSYAVNEDGGLLTYAYPAAGLAPADRAALLQEDAIVDCFFRQNNISRYLGRASGVEMVDADKRMLVTIV
jgi:hypothetical protein